MEACLSGSSGQKKLRAWSTGDRRQATTSAKSAPSADPNHCPQISQIAQIRGECCLMNGLQEAAARHPMNLHRRADDRVRPRVKRGPAFNQRSSACIGGSKSFVRKTRSYVFAMRGGPGRQPRQRITKAQRGCCPKLDLRLENGDLKRGIGNAGERERGSADGCEEKMWQRDRAVRGVAASRGGLVRGGRLRRGLRGWGRIRRRGCGRGGRRRAGGCG